MSGRPLAPPRWQPVAPGTPLRCPGASRNTAHLQEGRRCGQILMRAPFRGTLRYRVIARRGEDVPDYILGPLSYCQCGLVMEIDLQVLPVRQESCV